LVLIVDDYADALDVWITLLRAEGFDVVTAATGPEALETALRDAPHVVVLDLGLPGMSGMEVARALRSNGASRLTPLVALTGYSDSENHERAREAGFDVVLTKPCVPSILVGEIRRLLAA
jgi:CheY-like chemotaxis protein